MIACRTCGVAHPEEHYHHQSDKRYRFKDCPKCMYQKRKAKFTEETVARDRQTKLLWRRGIKARLVDYFGGKCSACNTEYHQSVFDFHHLDPNEKEGQINSYNNYEDSLEEAKKCVMLCANCHRLVHAGEIKIGMNLKDLEKVKH